MKKKSKLLVLTGFMALLLFLGSNTIYAAETSDTSLIGSSEVETTSIVETSDEDVSNIDIEEEFESELSKLFSEEIVKYIMYGLSAFGGASGVLLVFAYLFKMWLKKKLESNDKITNTAISQFSGATDTLISTNNIIKEKDKQYVEMVDKVVELTNKTTAQTEQTEQLIQTNMKLEQDIVDIKKSLEIVLLRDVETIKSGDGVKVAKVLRSSKE